MKDAIQREVLVLVNPRSGVRHSFDSMRQALDRSWDVAGTNLCYQFCQSVEDSENKTRQAVRDGVETILVAGGDGTVNTIGRVLIGTDVAFGVIPCGSGNGFGRHFGIPLQPAAAVKALAHAEVQRIDVGYVNDMPFLVTCSMAWDAAIARYFERSPVRGILPYVLAGVQGFFEYRPQKMEIVLDGEERIAMSDALVCTVANLTQYGGGALIAPDADAGDGQLELVLALRKDAPKLFTNIVRVFDGSINRLPEVTTRRFRELRIRREHADPIQIDGELVQVDAEIRVRVAPSVLNVLVPR